MGKKYLNEIFQDEWDTLFGDQSIYQENENELKENQTYNVTIVQPTDGSIIQVMVEGETEPRETNFIADYDKTYTVGFKNGYNPNNRILNAVQGKIARDITIRSYDANTENKHDTYTVTIIQSPHQTINVLHNNKIKTRSFTAQRYDYYSSTITPSKGYNAGKLSNGSGVVTDDVTVSASPATLSKDDYVTLNIIQSPHQTVIVTYDGKDYKESFAAPIGTRYKVRVEADEGYIAGNIVDPGNGVLYTNQDVYAFTANIKTYSIYIIQSPHQTIKVTYNGTIFTSDMHFIPYNAQLTAVVEPDIGYNAGKISTTSLRVTSDYTFTATEPSVKIYTLTLKGTTNQTIKLEYTEPGKSKKSISSSKTDQKIRVMHNTTWTATITPDTNYKAGTLSATSGTVTANITISASNAVFNKYKVTVKQTAHQTITLKRSDTGATSTSGWSNIPHGTKVTASVKADPSYTAGKLNYTSKTIKENFEFNATAATIITRVLTLKLTAPTRNPWVKLKYTNEKDTTVTTNRLLTDYHGQTKNLKFTIKYNTSIVIMADGDPDYIRIWYNHVRQADLHGWESYNTPAITSNTTYHCQGNYTRSPYYDENGNYDYWWNEGGNGDGGGDGGDVGGDDGGHGGGGGDF